jgi:hypothetical protein
MNSVTSAWSPGSSVTMLFQSKRKYWFEPRSTTQCGRDAVISRWYIGKRRNMPPGPSSRDRSACSTPTRRRS